MKYQKLIFTSAVTAIAIGASYKLYQEFDHKTKTRRAINRIKALFDHPEQISGTWLEEDARQYSHDNFKTRAYFGGLVINDNGELRQYKFVLSAKNYALLDLKVIA